MSALRSSTTETCQRTGLRSRGLHSPFNQTLHTNFYFSYIQLHSFCAHMCPCVPFLHVPCVTYVGQRTASGIRSLLIPCEFWGLDSGCQAWQQAPLPAELSQCLPAWYFGSNVVLNTSLLQSLVCHEN